MGHLNLNQRYQIESFTKAGWVDSRIADELGVHKSTIRREKKRNIDQRSGQYRAELANRKSIERKKQMRKHRRFTEQMRLKVKDYIKKDFSPEQIKGHCDKLGEDCVSHERIYQYIWKDKKQGGELHTHLRRKGRKYRKRGGSKDSRGQIVNRIDIDQRPAIVDQKKRFGDFEVDTIIGKNHKGAIVTVNDRASGFFKMMKVEKRTAELVKNAIIKMLEPLKELVLTMTADNGKEFALHQEIAKALGLDFYFAKPYSSWQRGANENLNGLVRQYIPKKSDFSEYSDQYIEQINLQINHRPRKRLNFESPIQRAQRLTNMKVAHTTRHFEKHIRFSLS